MMYVRIVIAPVLVCLALSSAAVAAAPRDASLAAAGQTPVIRKILVMNHRLVVVGDNFAAKAVVLIDGVPQHTIHDIDHPSTRLIVPHGAEKVTGHQAEIRVRNPKGATSEPATASKQADQQTITLDDDGTTRTFHVGDTFLVYLGTDFDWTLGDFDQNVIGLVPGVLVIRGAQGLFQAKAPGQTTLTLDGKPVCEGDTPCPALDRQFSVTIVVVP